MMMHSIALGTSDSQGLRSLSDEEVRAVGGAGDPVPTCDVPKPPPGGTGPGADLYLWPLVTHCMN